jgi:parallel beta-helix repeat protein
MIRKIIALGVILIFLGISIEASNIPITEKSHNNYLYSIHDPIYINGNDDFTSENGVTGGSGSSSDPYIISGWEINASFQDGITIRNVSVFFEIKQCYVHSGGIKKDGIVFINVTNGNISNNIITKNRNGTIFKTQDWPWKENSSKNYIYNNNITNNLRDGIHFEHTFRGHHKYNKIFLNNITDNNRGIYLIMSHKNLIYSNYIYSNKKYGVFLFMCTGGGSYNKVYHNNFINNGEETGQAFQTSFYNDWDNGYPSGGNFWSDYKGKDKYSGPNQNIPGSDGIGDDPYEIFGYEEWDYDFYPLINPYGVNRPPIIIEITGPVYGRPGIEYTFCIDGIDPDGDNLYCMWNWGDGTHSGWLGPYSSGEAICKSHTWTAEGTYSIKVKLRDEYGNESGELQHIIMIEANPPYAWITRPKRAVYIHDKARIPFFVPVIFGKIQIWFGANDSESGLNYVELYIDNTLKETFHSIPKSWTWDEKVFLRHTIKIIAYDNAGNNATTQKIVWKFF